MVGLVVEELGAQTVVDEKLIVFDLCTYLKGSILKPISR
jgi:hypothetical protein